MTHRTPVPFSFSASAVDKLGQRLANASVPSPTDLEMLLAVQRDWSGALDAVLAVVSETLSQSPPDVRLHITHRVKTVEPIVDKLRRGTRLSRMQDVVGIRIVGPRGLAQQDDVVKRLAARFDVVRVDDRRSKPSHGYRAVHLVPEIDRLAVEIQVRTGLQHAWANATERLADQWGRTIRYGEPPTGMDAAEVAERQRALDHWLRAAEAIASIELAAEEMAADLHPRVADATRRDPALSAAQHAAAILADHPEIGAPVDRASSNLSAILAAGGRDIGRALRLELDRLKGPPKASP